MNAAETPWRSLEEGRGKTHHKKQPIPHLKELPRPRRETDLILLIIRRNEVLLDTAGLEEADSLAVGGVRVC